MSLNLAQYAEKCRKRADAIPALVVADLKDAGDAALGFSRQHMRERFRRRPKALAASGVKVIETSGSGGVLRVRFGDGVDYAKIQEEGGTVRARGMLVIPIAGWVRTMLRRSGASALRGIADTRIQEIRGGSTLLLLRSFAGRGKAARGARSELLAVMVRSAKHQGKHFLRDGFREALAFTSDARRAGGIIGGADGLS